MRIPKNLYKVAKLLYTILVIAGMTILLLMIFNSISKAQSHLVEKLGTNKLSVNEVKWNSDKVNTSYFTLTQSIPSGRLARAYTGIYMDYNYMGTHNIKAYAVWDKSKSLIVDTLSGDNLEEVIAHEQGHFDITEYITRCLNNELKDVPTIAVADKLYYLYLDKLDWMQKMYDTQTEHYSNKPTQLVWNDIIYRLLKDNEFVIKHNGFFSLRE